jgi:hypothetical protein
VIYFSCLFFFSNFLYFSFLIIPLFDQCPLFLFFSLSVSLSFLSFVLSNSGVRELEIKFPPTYVTCVFYVAVQSKILLSRICLSFLYCCSFLFKNKKIKKSSACLCLIWKQNKPFFKWFSLAFSRTKKKKEKKGMSMVTGTSPVEKKKKSFFFFWFLWVQYCAFLCNSMRFLPYVPVRFCPCGYL